MIENFAQLILKIFVHPIIYVLTHHKFKLFFFIFSFIFFSIALFPFSEVSESILAQVNKATNSKPRVDASDLGISLFPFGLKLQNLNLSSPEFKEDLFASKLVMTPNVLDLIKRQPGGQLKAVDLLGGDVKLSGSLKEPDFEGQVEFENLSLYEIAKFAGQAGIKIQGRLSGKGDTQGNLKFTKQPEGQLDFNILDLKLPALIPSMPPLGLPLNLPPGVISKSTGELNFKEGKINITKLNLGLEKDPIQLKLTGTVEARFNPRSKNIYWGKYDLAVDLKMKNDFEKIIGPILQTVLPQGKRQAILNSGARYNFKVTGYPNKDPQFR